jgi:hypothetical protein
MEKHSEEFMNGEGKIKIIGNMKKYFSFGGKINPNHKLHEIYAKKNQQMGIWSSGMILA